MPKKKTNLIKSLTNRAEIVLGCGAIAIIDAEDIEKVRPHYWVKHLHPDRDESYGYARTRVPVPGAKNWLGLKMHHLVIGKAPNGMMVDHINGNSLDNRKRNLRFITRAMNKANSKKSRGVYFRGGKWVALIRIEKKLRHLGVYSSEEEALSVRRRAEIENFGEFAPQKQAQMKDGMQLKIFEG